MSEPPHEAAPEPPQEPAAEAPAEPASEPAAETPTAEAPAEPEARPVTEIKKPSTLGGVIYLLVLVAALIGVGVAATGAWRTGVSWLALSLLAAAAARVALTDDDAGMLRVRRKALDATILTTLGVALLVLAATIPDQPA